MVSIVDVDQKIIVINFSFNIKTIYIYTCILTLKHLIYIHVGSRRLHKQWQIQKLAKLPNL